jgi:F0F1-type ATP synthase membrane subunit b/b'
MVEKAKREVERVVVQGKAQLKTEGETMLRDMRKDIVELAVDATRKILNEAIDEKKATSLAEEVVRKMT